ncbi:hypothetical protein K445DRAFT_322500 [Daldinia sp. EC12]|nr:hypothetical protein K445DRAFT_322500 [Daldinia sp. EC12]
MRCISDSGGRPTHSAPYVLADKYALTARVSRVFVLSWLLANLTDSLAGPAGQSAIPASHSTVGRRSRAFKRRDTDSLLH